MKPVDSLTVIPITFAILIVLLAVLLQFGLIDDADFALNQQQIEQYAEQTYGDNVTAINITGYGEAMIYLDNGTMVRYPGHEDADVSLNVSAGVVG